MVFKPITHRVKFDSQVKRLDKCDDNECHSFVFRVSVSDHVDVCSNVKTDC